MRWAAKLARRPNLPAALLRGIARFSGVYLYNDAGDVLYATRELLGVHTVSGGDRTFRLPREVTAVYDLFERRVLARDTNQFRVKLLPASTALYYFGGRRLFGTPSGAP